MANSFWDNQESIIQLSSFQASYTYSSLLMLEELFLTKQVHHSLKDSAVAKLFDLLLN